MSASPLPPLRVVDLGVRDFAEVWRTQLDLVAQRQGGQGDDTLLLVEHPHVITLGRGSHRENLLDVGDVPIFDIERGGDVTYHGPGQLVGYPIVALRAGPERDLHAYLRAIEQGLIDGLGQHGIVAGRRPGWTGAWVGERKIASIGVAVKKWVTLHGFALNVATDLQRFAAINPCGLEAHVMTSMAEILGQAPALPDVARSVSDALAHHLGRAPVHA